MGQKLLAFFFGIPLNLDNNKARTRQILDVWKLRSILKSKKILNTVNLAFGRNHRIRILIERM